LPPPAGLRAIVLPSQLQIKSNARYPRRCLVLSGGNLLPTHNGVAQHSF
jgi:hypothetical protein